MADAKKSHKAGKNAATAAVYKSSGRREIHKAARIARHIKRNPWDKSARTRYALFSRTIQKPLAEFKDSPVKARQINDISLSEIKAKRKNRRAVAG